SFSRDWSPDVCSSDLPQCAHSCRQLPPSSASGPAISCTEESGFAQRQGVGNLRTSRLLREVSRSALATAVAMSASVGAATAQNWQGGVSSDWHDGANWSGGAAPTGAVDPVVDTVSPNPLRLASGVVDFTLAGDGQRGIA